jgi:hypothetical protein
VTFLPHIDETDKPSGAPPLSEGELREWVASGVRDALLRRADDHYRAEMAAWTARASRFYEEAWADRGARDFEEPPPELHGTDHTAVVRTADGAEIVFLLRATSAAGADSELATPICLMVADDNSAGVERNWRIKSGLASGPPPPEIQKRKRRPGFHTRAAHLAQGPISRSPATRQYSSLAGRATSYARRWERSP